MLPVPITRAWSGQSTRSFRTLTLSSSTSPHATSRATGAGRIRHVHVVVAVPFSTRTVKVWVPTARPGYSFGELQPAKGPVSSLHSNAAPAASATNSNVASVATVVASGADVIVSAAASTTGGSTHQSYAAGVRSTLPAASTART